MSTNVAVLDDVATEEFLCGGDFVAESERAPEDAPRKLFYGWLMLPVAMLMMMATSPGQTFGLAFFNSNFRTAFGLSQTKLSVTYLFATVVAALAIPTIGGWIDRFGLKRSVQVAIVGMIAACVFASQVQGVITLFFAFVLLRAIGPGSMALMANNTLAAWFDRRLGLASGLMQVGMAGALAVVPVGILSLIDTFGWRGAFLAIAGIIACLLLPLVLFFYRESPSELGLLPDGGRASNRGGDPLAHAVDWGMDVAEARQYRAYWILIVSAMAWAMVGTGLVFHLDAIFQSKGMGLGDSARAMFYLAISMGAMQLVGGVLADRLPLQWLLVVAIGLIAVSCALLAAGQATMFVAAYAVYGAGQGLKTIVVSTAWARYFGRAHLGKIRGISITAAIAGSSIGPLVLGVSADYLGGFTPALWLLSGIAFMVSILGFWATSPLTQPPVVKRPVAV